MKLDELSQILREVDPAAVLVPPTALARVVQNVMGITWAVWSIPHSHCLSIDRATLLDYVEQEDLYLPPDHQLPETVLVLERPSNDQLAASKNSELLSQYWRLLFHASVHRAIEHRLAGLVAAEFRERIERIGTVAFEEARNVLIEDGHLDSKADDRAAYIEFAAFFLELRFFASNLVHVYFPSLPSVAEVESVLALDVDGAALFKSTRLRGAPDPTPKTDDQSDESEDFYRRLTQSAERAASTGDTVAAAILHTKAARVAPATMTKPAQTRAREAIYHLVSRLQRALGLSDPKVESAWRDVLPTLLDKADQGLRPVEAALLYDLQRACLDAEQTIYTLDILEWFQSAGRKPIKRPLDSQRFVRIPEHVRSAIRRLAAARLTDADRQALGSLLRDALDRAEVRLRERFRPVLTDALIDAGLKPGSLAEQAALEKTVEELLDRISSAGFLGYSDLRDAIARGQMKLADLSGPDKAVRGDPLLRLDRRLAHLLDGVYRGAELYTRGLEFMTSLAFGTDVGRWITINLALPFGGAFLVGQFIWLLTFEQRRSVGVEPGEEPLSFFGGWNASWEFHAAWLLLSFAFLITIRSAQFRSALFAATRMVYRCFRTVLWDTPIRIWCSPVTQSLVKSVPVQLVNNYIGKPLVFCALLWLIAPSFVGTKLYTWIIVFVVADVVLNTRLGRAVDLLLLQLSRKIIDLIRAGPAVIRWVNDIFLDLLDALDWVMARTEDWLRIRGRSGPMAVVVRAVATIFWMPIAFLIRFYTVVLIEPMLNPLKLPLSILFAKFVYPLLALLGLIVLDPFSSPLVPQLSPPLPHYLAYLLVVGTFYLSPDLVTYLFWEMRENWRLYRANNPDRLEPAAVGPNGETVEALLHVSFHSGTVPRLYARLRTAELEAAQTDIWRDARTYRQQLRGVEESIRRFVMRDLVAVLNSSPSWGDRKLSVGFVSLGTNRISVQLILEGDADSAWLGWEDRSGWLVAGCTENGFLKRLPSGAIRVFENALTYLYKRAGVDLIREQIKATLSKETVHFDFAPNGLLVWYGSRDTQPLLYDPDDPVEELRPRDPTDRHLILGPTVDANRLVFSRLELTWRQWLEVWKAHDRAEPPRFGPTDWDLTLLPG
jgi:hypothetical protein